MEMQLLNLSNNNLDGFTEPVILHTKKALKWLNIPLVPNRADFLLQYTLDIKIQKVKTQLSGNHWIVASELPNHSASDSIFSSD